MNGDPFVFVILAIIFTPALLLGWTNWLDYQLKIKGLQSDEMAAKQQTQRLQTFAATVATQSPPHHRPPPPPDED